MFGGEAIGVSNGEPSLGQYWTGALPARGKGAHGLELQPTVQALIQQ
jgi:hypothetical protein